MANRRGQGEGSCYQRKDGRWVAVVDLGTESGKRKRKHFYGASQADALDAKGKAIEDIRKGLPIVTERQTVAQFLDRWLTHMRPTIGRSPICSTSSTCADTCGPSSGATSSRNSARRWCRDSSPRCSRSQSRQNAHCRPAPRNRSLAPDCATKPRELSATLSIVRFASTSSAATSRSWSILHA